jgi:hypothetical protein
MLLRTVACLGLVLCAWFPMHAQQGQSRSQAGWPCAGRVDPAYIRSAEATGGKVLLVTPDEVSAAVEDMSASKNHDEVVLRAAGQLEDGVHEFEIPLDSMVESAYVFVSLQCLQFVTVVQPSGAVLQVDTPEVDYHEFAAVRLFVIKAPTPGAWKVTMAGRGFFSLIVQARTELALTHVSFVRNGVPISGLAPLGQSVRLEATTHGDPRQAVFHLISLRAAILRTVELGLEQETDARRTYAREVTLPTTEFRLLMTGIDPNGFPFQRVSRQLFIGDR